MVIPDHLAHLPTWRGMPVPFINGWTVAGEFDEHNMHAGPDALVRGDGWYLDDTPGEGVPDFTRQAPQRQRLVASYGLCQVCARPVPSGPRHLLVLGSKLREVDGHERLLLAEPWLHESCLAYVQRVCPGVRRERPQHIIVEAWDLVVDQQWHDDYGPEVQAAMWVHIVPVGYEVRSGAGLHLPVG